jgi:flagellar basal body-associated protein FliL
MMRAGNLAARICTDAIGMMRMLRVLVATTVLAGLSSAAMAADPKKEEKGDAGQYVDLQTVPLPIVSKNAVVNYVFVYVRINLTSAANAAKLREMEPMFRDALVRMGHRTPYTLSSDLTKIDAPRLISTLTREANAIAGPGQIRSVVLTSQEPRRRTPLRPA